MPAPYNYYTGTETPPNYTTDPAMYYPVTYYSTGYETPAIYTDQSNYYALEGQTPNPHYSAENLPYLYYVPGYMYPGSDQYSNLYQSYQPYQSPVQPAPSGYVQYFVQPESQPLTLTSPGQPNHTVSGTGTNNARSGNSYNNNNNNSGTRNRANASTSTTISLSPVSLVTGASRSSHHNQITPKPSENQDQTANSSTQNPVTEQNKGPRTNKSNGSTSKKSTPNPHSYPSNSIKVFAEMYTGVDFSVDFPKAKFFVIKSYSEDDVHKSIKYKVWSSTPNGNRRLNAAYLAAQEVAAEDLERGCPVFLFFSVNASGQFCGLAEMTGTVDFSKHEDVWQMDKWQGSFPVRWCVLKDVPHSAFRHITLENNENKPVTNSRDTQEVPYKAGINMLKIFKNTPLTSSVLEDFPFYEGRQVDMIKDKCRRLGRVYDPSMFVPALVVKTGSVVDRGKERGLEERRTGLEGDLGEKLELKEETESQVEPKEETEVVAKAELQVELKEEIQAEVETKEESKEETEAVSQVELKEKMEVGTESKEKTGLELKAEKELEKMEPKEKIETGDLVKEGSEEN